MSFRTERDTGPGIRTEIEEGAETEVGTVSATGSETAVEDRTRVNTERGMGKSDPEGICRTHSRSGRHSVHA